jgi:hypothetical protein
MFDKLYLTYAVLILASCALTLLSLFVASVQPDDRLFNRLTGISLMVASATVMAAFFTYIVSIWV